MRLRLTAVSYGIPPLRTIDSGGAMSLVTRFAPSPTGYLHLGHAYSALRWEGSNLIGRPSLVLPATKS